MIRQNAIQMAQALADGSTTSVELTKAHLDQITAVDGQVKAFLHVDAEGALAQAKAVDAKRKSGEKLSPLAGIPLALKDVLAQRGVPTTAGSRILQGWHPPYDSTVVSKLKDAGLVILGKTNMDEFAMGSSTENSGYGPTFNPWDLTRTPGGSSGGSAAAVSAFQAPLAVGSDTGGSIRQPAALTGIVGVRPTYGAVSRFGLIAYSSSLDQAGPFGRTVLDTALLHEVMAGHDPKDATSINAPVPAVVAAAKSGDVKGMKIGVIKQLQGAGYQKGVQVRFDESLQVLASLGAEIVEVDCPNFEYALAAYYLIAPSECSSNLARFDAMRYGLRTGDAAGASAEAVMSATRDAGFGREVKRRIILGTYALSSGYYDAYYGSAQKIRTLIIQDYAKAFTKADVL
ncbi:MAG: Asp-tRNA(Asn)/Glu-tRNA(Gln) amidotransferase subunit GatA, partial [Candidatus Planktophila sp.]|nr:Asp-tRNA(Asn)/Glu-tRNA(Gln) amidotransferase subunit GatA [Candidatus Planktophila sp.]